MANDINGELRNVLPGNIDYWNRVYATVAEANAAIPSTVVGSRNFREGKVVQIGTVKSYEEYKWIGGFGDGNLTRVQSKKPLISDNILLSKYRIYTLPPKDKWGWADESNISGVVPEIGNQPIFGTLTDGFLNIPVTLDLSSKFLGVTLECIVLKDIANFSNVNCYMRVNGSYVAFTHIKNTLVGNRAAYAGYFKLSTLQPTDSIALSVAIHSKNRPISNPIVVELGDLKAFYIDDDTPDGVFTVSDSLAKLPELATRINTNETKINSKLDTVSGVNKLNPATFRYGTFYYFSGNAMQTGNNNYGSTDYIPADPAGLVTTGAGTDEQGLASYVVFDADKKVIRRGNNTNQYTYVSGDAFVVFVYSISGNLNFAKTKAVFSGTVYGAFDEYTDYKPLTDLKKRVVVLEEKGDTPIGVNTVINGTPTIYGNVSNFLGAAIIERNIDQNYLVYRKTGTGNAWIFTPLFTPTGANLVHIRFTVEVTKVNTSQSLDIFVAQGSTPAAGKSIRITSGNISESGTYDVTFDPAFYTVYEGYTNFCIWINNRGLEGASSSITAKFTGLQVLELIDSVVASNISGDTTKELFESTDLALSEIRTLATEDEVFVSPLGKKYELAVQDNGSVVAIPIIPLTAAFFGNSLIGGFVSYGMAASDSTKDYYYLITEHIKLLNPAFTSTRIQANPFEGITDPALIDSVIQSQFLNKLTGNENLISIQLGDNVNTPEKVAVFQQSALRALQAIRAKCPNARVVWMAMWYGSQEKYDIIRSACTNTGSAFISLSDIAALNVNKSAIGLTTRRGLNTRTLAGVNSVVVNNPTNITVNFTIGSTAYTSTLNVTSHSLSGSTLTYVGEYEIISTSGVASHPGDEGFRKIANRFLYEMKISDDIETYKAIA